MSNFVGLLPQDKPNACWLACATMMRGWQDDSSHSIENTLQLLDTGVGNDKFTQAYTNDEGLAFADWKEIADILGLTSLPPASYSTEYFFDMLAAGPVMAIIMFSETSTIAHAVVIANISGDRTPDGSFMEINDPLPLNEGHTYSISLTDFLKKFEAVVAYENNMGVDNLYSQLYCY